MHLMEDHRKNKGDDDPDDEEKYDDSEALKLNGQNPLAEEESIQENDNGND